MTDDSGAQQPRSMHSGFLRSAERFAGRPALEVARETYSYAQLRELAARIAATIAREAPGADPALTAVFAHRHVSAFAGLLGALMQGHGYVPLNRALPPARSRAMLERAGCAVVVVDPDCAEQLPEVLDGVACARVVIAPGHDADAAAALAATLPAGVRLVGAGELAPATDWRPAPYDPNALAYLLFTSGSTGVPKGVMVAHRNVRNHIDVMAERYAIDEHDRVSQTHELTFDVSVFDMFVTWERGACLCCPSAKTLTNPGKWVRDAKLTVWFSVPSLAIFMRRLGALKPDRYPDLRWSLFAGEPLPLEVAKAWLAAAPNAIVENLYGPTEATIICVLHRFDPQTSPAHSEHGTVPIGEAVENLGLLIADEQLREVAPGEVGELLVRGPQVTLGYLDDPERTAAAFVVPPGCDEVHYRTGDLVRRPAEPGLPIPYLGRRDNQVKVRGVRIELGEVEAALREAAGVDEVAALGWPKTEVGVGGIEAFVAGDGLDLAAVRARLRSILPSHMVPRRIRPLETMPLNTNGKTDRGALTALLEAE